MDALTLLVDDHRRIDQLFDAVSEGDTTAVPQVCEALLLHSRMEEEVLYPTIHGNLEAVQWDVSAALEDHLIMRRLISELSEESGESPSYLTKAGVLMRLVRDHVREEDTVYRVETVEGEQPCVRIWALAEEAHAAYPVINRRVLPHLNVSE